MSSIKTYLRKLKYNLTYQFKSNLELPSDFRLFNRRDTSYQQFIYKHCRPDKNTNLDLGRSLKIFGKIDNIEVLQAKSPIKLAVKSGAKFLQKFSFDNDVVYLIISVFITFMMLILFLFKLET